MSSSREIVVRLPTVMAVFSGIAFSLCVLFPPQRWDDQIQSSYKPHRGFIFTPHARIKDWQSPHMYLDRHAIHDYKQLVRECFVVVAIGGILSFASIYIDRRFSR